MSGRMSVLTGSVWRIVINVFNNYLLIFLLHIVHAFYSNCNVCSLIFLCLFYLMLNFWSDYSFDYEYLLQQFYDV